MPSSRRGAAIDLFATGAPAAAPAAPSEAPDAVPGAAARPAAHTAPAAPKPARRRSETAEARRTPRPAPPAPGVERVKVSVNLPADEVDFLRSLSRPARTGAERTLGAGFVATGVLRAAIAMLRERGIDMQGLAAGEEALMVERATAALEASRPRLTHPVLGRVAHLLSCSPAR